MNQIPLLAQYLQQFEYDWPRFITWYHKQPSHQSLLTIESGGRSAALSTPKLKILILLGQLLVFFSVPKLTALHLAYHFLAIPDWLIKQILLTLATFRLKLQPQLTVIGITGSYGKTTTKELTKQLLEAFHYQVLSPPGSWNILTAVAWMILTRLRTSHQFLIVEMGAYRPGEIAAICNLVKPTIGILTAIGPVHLERFGSLEKIVAAKSELLQALPKNGLAIINSSDQNCIQAAKNTIVPIIWYSNQQTSSKISHKLPHLLVNNVTINANHTEFTLQVSRSPKSPKHQPKFKYSTSLLGRAAIANLLPGIAILWQLECHLSLDNCNLFNRLQQQLSSLSPAPHRLQIIRQDELMTIIDNSYSSNPAAATNSLEVLAAFPGRKIIITPGFVEMGNLQSSANQLFGQQLSKIADFVFIVGQTNQDDLKQGLLKTDFPSERIIATATRDEAVNQLSLAATPSCVVLFENDLPNYYQ